MISIASIFAESSCTAAFRHRRSSDVQFTTWVNKCQFTAKRCQLLYATQFDVALRNTSLLFYQIILASHTLLLSVSLIQLGWAVVSVGFFQFWL